MSKNKKPFPGPAPKILEKVLAKDLKPGMIFVAIKGKNGKFMVKKVMPPDFDTPTPAVVIKYLPLSASPKAEHKSIAVQRNQVFVVIGMSKDVDDHEMS